MKRLKKLGILLAVLVLACAATALLRGYEKKQEQIKNSDEIILEIAPETVSSLSWEYSSGDGLAFHKEGEVWIYDEDEAFPVSADKVEKILSHFEAFGVSFIIEEVTDYSLYGLDDPQCVLRIGSGESEYSIRLGDFSKMDEQRYVDIGDGNAYLVKDDPMEYISEALSSMIEHDDTPGFETVESIRFEGAEDYVIERIEDSGYSYCEDDVYFTQKTGEYLPVSSSAVTEYLNTITSLELLDYVTYNAGEEELKSCGLDEPELSVTVNYSYTDEETEEQISDSCLIHIGRDPAALAKLEAEGEDDEESVPMYVRIGDSRIIYELDFLDYTVLSMASFDDLRPRELFRTELENVTQIDISLEGREHILLSETDEERLWYYGQLPQEDAEETESLDISALEGALSDLKAKSFSTEKPGDTLEISLVLHLNDENFPQLKLEFYRYDGESCLAVVDGESLCQIKRSQVMELVEAVQAIVLSR